MRHERLGASLLLALLLLWPHPGQGQEAPSAWPFTRIEKPPLPATSSSPIDSLIDAKLQAANLEKAPLLSKPALLRRLALDLTGLPPTAEEVAQFLANESPAAYRKMVDHYLASPRYGERWARHWLDVVRYAETDGFAIDGVRPTLWRYRDYVIRTFNEDRPFDQFIREQIAGDELKAGAEGAIATGFYRLGQWEADNMVPEVKRQDYLNEITSAVGAVFLGLTLECARCHDHKYDPIPARDYYRLQDHFTKLEHAEVGADYLQAERNKSFDATKATLDAELSQRKEKLAAFRSTLRAKLAEHLNQKLDEVTDEAIDKAVDQDQPFSKEDKEQIRELTKAVATFAEGKSYASVAWTVSVAEKPNPEKTFVLGGGDPAVRGDRVHAGFLAAIPGVGPTPTGPTSRQALAEWLTHRDHPLTARVLANRIWLYHFGEGLVRTPNDFGRNGSGASHPKLLDYLAARLLDHDWRLKPLHREIVLSQSYRLSSNHPSPKKAETIDPDNKLLWRAHYRRLEAETVRDAMLAVSGSLNHAHGGPGFFEKLPREMGTDYPFFKWHPSSEEERRRRSIYMYQRRNMVHPMLESFDVADASESCARRSNSLHPLQAFDLLNSDFAHECSKQFAERMRTRAGDDPAKLVDAIFRAAFARPPTERERSMGVEFLQRPAGDKQDRLAELCLVIFNTNEFLYLE